MFPNNEVEVKDGVVAGDEKLNALVVAGVDPALVVLLLLPNKLVVVVDGEDAPKVVVGVEGVVDPNENPPVLLEFKLLLPKTVTPPQLTELIFGL